MSTAETLQYFNLGARAQYIRNAYKYGGIAFTDQRYEFAEWPEIKPGTPLGQLPVLTMEGDDMKYAQSLAMLRFVGGRAGLYPEVGTKGQLIVEDILETCNELWSNCPKVPADRPEYIKNKVAVGLAHVEGLVNAHSGTGAKYVLGDKMSVADLFVHGYVHFFSSGIFDEFPKDTFEKHAVIMKIFNNVDSHFKKSTDA